MGGGLASYAALRNSVPAVINPMRLGWGAPRPRVLQDIKRDFSSAGPRAAQLAFMTQDRRALQGFQPLFNECKPGGPEFEAIADQFGLNAVELDGDDLKRSLMVSFYQTFGQQGEQLSPVDTVNRRAADEALMEAISITLTREVRADFSVDKERCNALLEGERLGRRWHPRRRLGRGRQPAAELVRVTGVAG